MLCMVLLLSLEIISEHPSMVTVFTSPINHPPPRPWNFIQWWFCFVALICVMAFNFYPPASYWYRYILTFIYGTLNPDKPGTMWCPPLRYWFKSWQYFWCSITQKNLLQSYQKKTYFKSLWSLYNMMVLSKSSKLNLCFHLRAHLLKSVKKID